MKPPNTSLQVIELDPSCSVQAHSNRSGTGSEYESMEPGCILAVFHILSIIRSLRSVDTNSLEWHTGIQ